ncbi:hypothetical protein GCM10010166_39600 [Couchioplanes caeruleus subsp. azureus]|nr:hypothetical protein GCM10010166_39600 [Couchioplanes caeruleus subsp. azureus]
MSSGEPAWVTASRCGPLRPASNASGSRRRDAALRGWSGEAGESAEAGDWLGGLTAGIANKGCVFSGRARIARTSLCPGSDSLRGARGRRRAETARKGNATAARNQPVIRKW